MWWDWEGSQAGQSGHQQSCERDSASPAAQGIPCSTGCALSIPLVECAAPQEGPCAHSLIGIWLENSSDRGSSKRFWLLSVVAFLPVTGGTSSVCREYPQAWQMPLLSLANFISHSK